MAVGAAGPGQPAQGVPSLRSRRSVFGTLARLAPRRGTGRARASGGGLGAGGSPGRQAGQGRPLPSA
eukprot:9499342-Alexandrium_andersonii.AAC.1